VHCLIQLRVGRQPVASVSHLPVAVGVGVGDSVTALLAELLETVLLLLVLAGQLLRVLLDLDGVAEGIRHLVKLLNLNLLFCEGCHPLRVTLEVEVALLENPCLRTQLRAEVVVMSDHDDTALELLDRGHQGAQGVTVEVVGRLI